jgi:GH25 family lysozyme M1 (1,4-beta-N-acetylmuramidase)
MVNGIDVSYANGYIDWAKVAASGRKFAMIKATQGRAVSSNSYLFADRLFAQNVTGARAAGLDVGVYHYLTAKTVKESLTEADHFIATIEPYRDKINLYAAVDVEEDKYLPRNKALLTDIVKAFCAAVRAAGYRPCIYTNPAYLVSRLNDVSEYPLWLACWNKSDTLPKGYEHAVIWQHAVVGDEYAVKKKWATQVGSVPGVSGSVDLDRGYYESLNAVPAPVKETFRVGDKVTVAKPVVYGTTRKFSVFYPWYDVMSVSGDRVVIGRNKTVAAAVAAENLKKA